jgi:hypothetical protein
VILSALRRFTQIVLKYSKHKKERTDAATAPYYSYPRDSNPRAGCKKITNFSFFNVLKIYEIFIFILQLFCADAKI